MRTFRPAVLSDADRLLIMCRSARFKLRGLPSLTFVAEEDDKIQAAMGLNFEAEDTHIVVGPLVVAPEAKHKHFLILRLIETAEAWLTQSGATSYLFSIPCANKKWNRIVKHLGLTPYATKNGSYWYVRSLNNGQATH